jgi:esterase/lipase superfamily enzyme
MRREIVLHTLPLGDAKVIAYGHWGRPVLVFASDSGRAEDFENNGLLGAVAPLLEEGRVKIYCIDSFESHSWRRSDLPLEQRAQQHQRFEDFVVNDVVPFIYGDCGGTTTDILVTGCSFGAFHAANFTLRHAELFPRAICLSGAYDMSRMGWGEQGDAFYFNNPVDYVANLHGDHLEWLRSRVHLTLVAGQGPWEDDSASGALPSTLRLAGLLAGRGIPHERPWWQRQLAVHLPRHC